MRKIFFFFLIIFFAGCSIKPLKVEPYIITIKSKKFKFSDYGFIEKYSNFIKIKVYNAGNLIKEIKINSNICDENGCISKSDFNKIYLSKYYPKNLLKNIFLKKPIFDSKNIISKNGVFEQRIYKKNKFDIIYKIDSKRVYFKDKINKILIKIKNVDSH